MVAFRIVAGSGIPPSDQAMLRDRLGGASDGAIGRFIEMYKSDASKIGALVESIKAKRAARGDIAELRKIFARERERVASMCAD